jgi:hypothetical protein
MTERQYHSELEWCGILHVRRMPGRGSKKVQVIVQVLVQSNPHQAIKCAKASLLLCKSLWACFSVVPEAAAIRRRQHLVEARLALQPAERSKVQCTVRLTLRNLHPPVSFILFSAPKPAACTAGSP